MAATPDPAAIRPLPLRSIQVSGRLRAVDPATVANLQTSIEETGWFGSILVRPLLDDELGPRYELVAGAHRFAAMKGLGRDVIPATIRVLTDDEALQIEIDENLVRRGLTFLERAEMVDARLKVWARRFPARVTQSEATVPKRGRPTNSAKFAEFMNGVPETMGFAAETAAQVGLSERTIRSAFSMVSGLPADLRARLHGTPIAKNEGLLRQLAALGDKAEQAAVAELLISGQAKNVSDGRAIAAGAAPMPPPQTSTSETVKAFRALWGGASPIARTAILNDLLARKLPGGFRLSLDEAGDE
jgi:ParB family chromosome partitioning protein